MANSLSNAPHTFYGNHSLQNRWYQYTMQAPRDISPIEVQDLQLARGTGSAIANIRTLPRKLKMKGGITGVARIADEQSLFQDKIEFLKFFMQKQQRWLRVIPEDALAYKLVWKPTNSTSGFTALGDANTLAVQTDHPQWEDYRMSFNSTAAQTGSHFAGYSWTFTPVVDLATLLGTGNGSYLYPQFDFSVKIPDVSEITSVELRIGTNASNYYSKVVTTNYEGLPFENGVNLLSVPFWVANNLRTTLNVSQTGTVTKSSIGYAAVIYNYSSTTPNLTDYGLDFVALTDDKYVRNFPCTLSGGLGIGNEYEEVVTGKLDFELLNNTGRSTSTQTIQHVDSTGITGLTNDVILTLPGNTTQQPTDTSSYNNTPNLDTFNVTNLSNGETFSFTDQDSDAWAVGDILTFNGSTGKAYRNTKPQKIVGKIPFADPGRSRFKFAVGTNAADQSIKSETSNTDRFFRGENPVASGVQLQRLAQSFLSGGAGTLTKVGLYIRGVNYYPANYFVVGIYSNSGSSPGTLLSNTTTQCLFSSYYTLTWQDFAFAQALSAATTYWIVVDGVCDGVQNTYGYWAEDTTAPYSNGQGKYYNSSWVATNRDFAFRLTIESTISINYDLSITAPILYN